MAKVLLKLDLFPNSETKIDNYDIGGGVPNNTSKPLGSKLEKNDGKNCLIMGRYAETKKLGGGLIVEYNGLQGGITSPNGDLDLTLTLTSRIEIAHITIMFDKEAHQFAKECIIDGKTYYNDDYEWSIEFATPKPTQVIKFTKWNRGNYHWCITYIGAILDNLIINGRYSPNIDNLSQLQPLQEEPYYSLISKTGDVQLSDTSNEIVDYSVDGILKSNQIVKIFVNDKLLDSTIVDMWEEPNVEKKSVKATFTDKIKLLETEYNGEIFSRKVFDDFMPCELLKILVQLLLNANNTNKMYPYNVFVKDTEKEGDVDTWRPASGSRYNRYVSDSTGKVYYWDYSTKTYKEDDIYFDISRVVDILAKMKIQIALINKGTYKSAIDKVCQIAQIQGSYSKDNTKLIFYNARPRLVGNEPIINITANAQMKDFTQKIMPNNNYNKITVYKNKITRENTNAISSSIVSWDKKNDGYSLINKSSNPDVKLLATRVNYDQSRIKANYADYEIQIPKNSTYIYDDVFLNYSETREINSNTQKEDFVISNENSYSGKDKWLLVTVSSSESFEYNVIKNEKITAPEKVIVGFINNPSLDYFIVRLILLTTSTPSSSSTINGRLLNSNIKLNIPTLKNNYIKDDFFNGAKEGNSLVIQQNELFCSSNFLKEQNSISIGYEYLNNYTAIKFTAKSRYEVTSDIVVKTEKMEFTIKKGTKVSVDKPEHTINANISDNVYLKKYETIVSLSITRDSQQIYTFGDNTFSRYIADNIFEDYNKHNGIRTAELTISCGVNFYDTNGNLAIDWNNKDSSLPNAFEKGQIVKILDKNGVSKSKYKDGTDRVWRIIGCEFKHNLLPKWHLQLMEVW